MADPRFLGRNTGYVPGGGNGWTLPAELGYIAQSVVPGISTVGAAGTLFLRRMSLPGPIVVTDMSMIISVVGVTLTANQCFCGVWDGTGALVGLSADQS